jgi:hypothetical protein
MSNVTTSYFDYASKEGDKMTIPAQPTAGWVIGFPWL